jgi:hypothetical protein
MLGIATSDMTKSGDSERAAASASSGQVKNLAEKPFICNMAARLDAMTGSSSTTKMHELERGDTWVLFRVFLCVGSEAEGLSGVSMFLGPTPILFTIAHSAESPGRSGTRRPPELFGTDSARDRSQYDYMRKKKRVPKVSARATIAGLKKGDAKTTIG